MWLSRATHFTGFAPELGLDKVGIRVTDAAEAGVFRQVRSSDGSALLVGEMVPRKGLGKGAVFVVGSDDPFDVSNRTYRVTFRADASLLVRDQDGVVDCRRESDGSYTVPLRSNGALLIEAF